MGATITRPWRSMAYSHSNPESDHSPIICLPSMLRIKRAARKVIARPALASRGWVAYSPPAEKLPHAATPTNDPMIPIATSACQNSGSVQTR